MASPSEPLLDNLLDMLPDAVVPQGTKAKIKTAIDDIRKKQQRDTIIIAVVVALVADELL